MAVVEVHTAVVVVHTLAELRQLMKKRVAVMAIDVVQIMALCGKMVSAVVYI